MAQIAYRLLTFSFALCLTAACTAASPLATPSPTPTPTILAETAVSPINQIAQDFQKLRPLAGQFNGGDWNADVDEWMGEKHSLMLALHKHVESARLNQADLVKLMGEPDTISTGGDPLFEQIELMLAEQTAVTVQDELLIYEWRGTNDFLFFVGREGTIVHSDWWHAGE